MTQKIQNTDKNGVTVGGKFVEWRVLEAAAKQEDAALATAYADILRRAKQIDDKRIISEDWKEFGYPLRTGFGRQYQGQHVMRAWEIRRVSRVGKDVRVAYIVSWDRSDNTRTRTASPDLAEYDGAIAWLSINYGGWHDELGGERTADTWLYA